MLQNSIFTLLMYTGRETENKKVNSGPEEGRRTAKPQGGVSGESQGSKSRVETSRWGQLNNTEGACRQPVCLRKLQVGLGSGAETTVRMSNDKSGGLKKNQIEDTVRSGIST